MKQETINKIKELNERIKQLPKGYISIKNIGGNIYYYHQWSENGKKNSKYVNGQELYDLDILIKKRQLLEQQLKLLKKGFQSSELLYCSLMHLNNQVVDLTISFETGRIHTIGDVYLKELLPIGVKDIKSLLDWWNDRSIPLTRSGIRDALDKLNISDPKVLLLKCFGLSLSDQYWIKPKDENISWEDINFFENDFSEDLGTILLNGNKRKKELNLSSPDSTSVGNLKKRWKIINNKRVMMKGGSNPYRQEPFNEVVASEIASILGLDSVQYSFFDDGDYPYSKCEDFINNSQDLVTAYQINKVLKKNNNDSAYSHFVKCAHHLGIENVEDYLDKLIVFDFIIANEDRHFNNFGFIRDAITLKFIGPSPIFDSGASFGFDKLTFDIKPFKDIVSKPFKEKPLEQLKLVKSFKWLSIDKLNILKERIKPLFLQFESKYLDKERITAISDSLIARVDFLIKNYL
ncbi:MAG: excisionase [Bacilli bacterium]|nr:excisionase [Bacilli bacterium]